VNVSTRGYGSTSRFGPSFPLTPAGKQPEPGTALDVIAERGLGVRYQPQPGYHLALRGPTNSASPVKRTSCGPPMEDGPVFLVCPLGWASNRLPTVSGKAGIDSPGNPCVTPCTSDCLSPLCQSESRSARGISLGNGQIGRCEPPRRQILAPKRPVGASQGSRRYIGRWQSAARPGANWRGGKGKPARRGIEAG